MTVISQAPSSLKGAFSLKKSQLFNKKEFTELFTVSTKKHGRYFILFYQPGMVSLGAVVGKKHARTSIKRNLVKRLIREHFRLAQHELTDVQILLVAKKGIDQASRSELHADLTQLFSFLKKIS